MSTMTSLSTFENVDTGGCGDSISEDSEGDVTEPQDGKRACIYMERSSIQPVPALATDVNAENAEEVVSCQRQGHPKRFSSSPN